MCESRSGLPDERRGIPSMRAVIACLALAGLPTWAQEPLTLAGALRQAGVASLQSDNARLSQAAAREDSAQVKALYLPEFAFMGGFRALDERPGLLSQPMHLGAITVPSQIIPMEDKDSWRYKASLQYLVWDFGKRSRALSASRAKEEAVSFAGRGEILRAQSETASRYLALLNIKAQKRVVAQRRETLERHLQDVKALFEHGMVARNDLLRTEVALRTVGDVDHALDQGYASALEALKVGMGLPGTSVVALPEEIVGPPRLPWDETACRAKAIDGNPLVRAQKARVKALKDQGVLKRRDFLPNVVAEASHTYAQNSYMAHEHENAITLGLSWKVFDGGIRSAKVRQSDFETDRARRELLEAERQAESAAAAALRAYRQSLSEMDTSRENVKAAEENLRIVSDQYKEGLVRNTDVLDAESVLAESRSALAERRHRAYSQQVFLLVALGEDMPAFYETTTALEK